MEPVLSTTYTFYFFQESRIYEVKIGAQNAEISLPWSEFKTNFDPQIFSYLFDFFPVLVAQRLFLVIIILILDNFNHVRFVLPEEIREDRQGLYISQVNTGNMMFRFDLGVKGILDML